MHRSRSLLLLVCALACLAGPQVRADLVRKMDLPEVCDRAGRIFRGTVVDVTSGSLTIGGGELPTTTYRIRVTEGFKGDFETKNGESWVELRTIGKLGSDSAGDVRHFSPLASLPQLKVGGDYLLMTTPTSAVGLSVPVGLGQGCYAITSDGKTEMARNEVGHEMAYERLAGLIRADLGR